MTVRVRCFLVMVQLYGLGTLKRMIGSYQFGCDSVVDVSNRSTAKVIGNSLGLEAMLVGKSPQGSITLAQERLDILSVKSTD